MDVLGDSSPYTTPLTAGGAPVVVAHSNYVGVFGNPEITPDPGFLAPVAAYPWRSVAHRGMFYRNTAVGLVDVTDGTSNTLFVGERCSNLAYATWTGSVTGGAEPRRCPTLTAGGRRVRILVLGHTGDSSDVPAHTPNSVVAHVDDFWSWHPQVRQLPHG